MLFTSFEFVAFLACVLGLYYLIPVRFQWVLLLVANVFFYARSGLYGLLFMGVTIVTSYAAARIMSAVQYHMDDTVKAHKEVWSKQERKAYKQQIKRKKRMIFIGCLLVNLGILAVLKYTNFAIANVNGIAALFTGRHSIARVNLVLPLGISFYTFQTMGYVIDVYRGKAEAEKNIFKMALFTSFFPQLIQGPISRFGELSQTLYAPHRFDFRTVWFGLERVLWGYFKKLVIADRIVVAVNAFVGQPDIYSGFYVFCGMLFYAAELYADFTGGIDITIGIAQMFGIQLAENFERPYFSKNIAEYWRRWHITLSTWFKEYLYIPLGGNRRGLARQALNLLIVWTLTGFWHGAGWNFVMWGLYYFAILFIEKLFLLKALDKLPRLFRHAYALLLIVIGWVIFASDDESVMLPYLGSMFGANGALGGMDVYTLLTRAALMGICCVASTELPRRLFVTAAGKMNELAAFTVKSVLTLALLALSVVFLIGDSYNPFLYFRF